MASWRRLLQVEPKWSSQNYPLEMLQHSTLPTGAYKCVSVFVCVHVCVHACVCLRTCMCVRVHPCVCLRTCMCMRVHVCVCMHVCACVAMHACAGTLVVGGRELARHICVCIVSRHLLVSGMSSVPVVSLMRT